MGRGLSDLQRNMLVMAYLNHRDMGPGSKPAKRVNGPDDGKPYAETETGRLRRSTHDYPYCAAPTIHLFYSEPIAWLYGFLDFYACERAFGRSRVFDMGMVGERPFRSAQVSVSRAMNALHRRELCVYANWRNPTGLALLPAGIDVARTIHESGRYDRGRVDGYANQWIHCPPER